MAASASAVVALKTILSVLDFLLFTDKTYSSLFIFHKGPDTAYLLLYVDDIILTASSTSLRQRIISLLHAEFAMTDLGPLNYFLDISATRTTSGVFLSQTKYATKILEQAQILNCNPCRTLIDIEKKLGPEGSSVTDLTLYRILAGSLQYLTITRPDLSYAVQQLCLYMHDPQEPYFNDMKHVLRYLRGTTDLGLQLFRSTTSELIAYSDADWTGCLATCRSTSGYCVFLGNNLLTWSSKHKTRCLILVLRPNTAGDLGLSDNVRVVCMSANPVQHQWTKHIEIDIHFVHDKVAADMITGIKEKSLNMNKTNTGIGLSTAFDGPRKEDKLSSLEDTTVLESFPPSTTPVTTMASNAPGKSSYANITGKPSGKKVNVRTLFTPEGNGIDVAVSVDYIRAISERFTNIAYGFFLEKKVAYPVVANYVRNTWGKYRPIRLMFNLSTGLLSFQFSSIDGLNTMFENGPWLSGITRLS
uniref:Ribonuclease H-like domain-containing protein n=1 Tax=Tanacetum cinerariifolium TaxID=118510 RepID=A0A6L2P1W5_TANCI|nr:ribonuclease H-like domain-containing protein [Tanacetum cinerariifolium]